MTHLSITNLLCLFRQSNAHQLLQPILLAMVVTFVGRGAPAAVVAGQPDKPVGDVRLGRLIKVRLPIDDSVKREVRSALEAIAETAPLAVRPEQRLVAVLEFDTRAGKTGRGSDLEACQSLARAMMDKRFNGIDTIAYLPGAQSGAEPLTADQPQTVLSGHAVLVAVCANRLALAPGTAIGNAGIDEPVVDELVQTVYRTLSQRRGRLPSAMVASMLDPSVGLARIQNKDKSIQYVDIAELEKIEANQILEATDTIARPGNGAVVTAQQLKQFGLISLTPSSKSQLENELGLARDALKFQMARAQQWQAMQIQLPIVIDGKAQQWMIRSVNERVRQSDNLIIISIEESYGGSNECLAIAQHLVELKRDNIQTVAFVRGQAQGAVGVIALACDHLIMAPDAVLGGFPEKPLDEDFIDQQERDRLRPTLQSLAKAAEKDWSIMMAMLDPNLEVTRYRDTKTAGKIRLMTDIEAQSLGEQLDRWQRQDVLSVSSGLKSATADRFGLVRLIAQDIGQLQTFYQLEQPPTIIELTSTHRLIDRIADFFRHPLIGMFLLLGSVFFISNEMSAPGLGVPGFLGAMCVALYFWSHWFGGEAEVFEILMFVLGLIFIGVEVFVIPGFGIFGIGGIVLVLVSIVLAAQEFRVPLTSAQWSQLPGSLLPVVGAGLGFVGAVFFLQSAIEKAPFLRRLVLKTNDRGRGFEDKDPEAVVDWSHLLGQTGATITRLAPAGKARIAGGIYDVLSTGQMVDKGVTVEVVQAVANRVVVQPKEN